MVSVMRFCEGGEQVANGRAPTRCHFCMQAGDQLICRAAFQACELPEPEPAPPTLRQRLQAVPVHAWAAAAGGALGVTALALLARPALLHLFSPT